ncbi:hypothetical protein [Methylocapsa acidiphila]|uniref:hypothetical protein n=1 Tax=Methylocapsa acidiphila TaxID=133552 RepID=UPI00047EAF3E|nr:hypothetical protein [Methylocapsa acidiphila]
MPSATTPAQTPQPAQATPPDQDPPIVNFQFSRGQFYSLLGVIAAAFFGLLYVIYGGLKDEIKETKNATIELNSSFREAYTKSIDVKDLLSKSPRLEQTLAETHDVVLHLQDSMKLLEHVPERIDAIQIDEQKIRIQLDNVQKQVHSIPGVPK